MSLACLKPGKDGVLLLVQAVPRSSRNEVFDLSGERCRMKIKAPPVDGEANEALLGFLAKLFGLPKRSVQLQSGERGKQKTVLLGGLALDKAEEVLRSAVRGNTVPKEPV